MAYTLELTDRDFDAINFAGVRYCWSTALLDLDPGTNKLSEADAWNLREAFVEDTST